MIKAAAHNPEDGLPAGVVEQAMPVRQGYDRWAASYDDRDPTTQLDEPILRQLCQGMQAKRVLDVACGTGRYTRLLTEQGARVTGVDLSRPMLLRARKQLAGTRISWVQAAADRLPFASRQFDAVTCGLLLDHIEHPVSVLAEMARVVRPGGLVVVSTVHTDVQIFHHGQVRFRQGHTLCWMAGWMHQPDQLLVAFRQAGLKVTATFEPVIDASFVQQHPQWRSRLDKRALLIVAACGAPCLHDQLTS